MVLMVPALFFFWVPGKVILTVLVPVRVGLLGFPGVCNCNYVFMHVCMLITERSESFEKVTPLAETGQRITSCGMEKENRTLMQF